MWGGRAAGAGAGRAGGWATVRQGWGRRGWVSVPSFLKRRRRGPGCSLGGTLHAKGGLEEALGVLPEGPGSSLTCARAVLPVAGCPSDGGPGRAVRARLCALVCVCARAREGQTPELARHPPSPQQTQPAPPEAHLELVCERRRGGEGTAPLKGSPPLRSNGHLSLRPPPARAGERTCFHS